MTRKTASLSGIALAVLLTAWSAACLPGTLAAQHASETAGPRDALWTTITETDPATDFSSGDPAISERVTPTSSDAMASPRRVHGRVRPTLGAQDPQPILDVHLHAQSVSEWGESIPMAICAPFEEFRAWDPAQRSYDAFFSGVYLGGRACDEPVWSPLTDEEVMRQTIEIMERRNIYGVLSGTPDRVDAWREATPGRLIPALHFILGVDEDITPDSLRRLILTGKVEVFGEIANAYGGIAPDDPRMKPYWALAEELDVPVAYHLHPGRPGEPYAGYGARGRLVRP